MKTIQVKWSTTLEDGTKKSGEVDTPQFLETDVVMEFDKSCAYTIKDILTLANRQLVTDYRNDSAREAKSGPKTRVERSAIKAMLMAPPFNKTEAEADEHIAKAMGK